MSWSDYGLARQFLVEERIGTRVRQTAHDEDQLFSASAKNASRR